METKQKAIRTWRYLRVSNLKAKRQYEYEDQGKAKCLACGHVTYLEIIEHKYLGDMILCELCSDLLTKRIIGWEKCKSLDDIRKAILKAHQEY